MLIPGPTSSIRILLAATALISVVAMGAAEAPSSTDFDRCREIALPESPLSATEQHYRCDLFIRLVQKGLDLYAPTAEKARKELMRPFSSTLRLEGEVPIPRSALDHLFQELPDTARLINHFEGTKYEVRYTTPDRSRLFATNNRNMKADFDIIDTDIDATGSSYLLFESGWARLLFWQFRGNTIIDIELTENAGKTRYEFIVHIFTDSRSYKGFFDSGLFRYLVGSMLRKIMANTADAALELQDLKAVIEFKTPGFRDTAIELLQTTAGGTRND